MHKYRILYKDSASEGRYEDIEAEDMYQAIWDVAKYHEHGEYVDIQTLE